tara:strand:+ start:246 stop:554 length:309 start_codon:yes stop_codon:yes gene_type:complete
VIDIQETARIDDLRPEIRYAILIVSYVLDEHKLHGILTHGNDGEHMVGSLHYKNRAIDVDWAPWDGPPTDIEVVRDTVKLILGEEYDVVAESTHLHIEHDPK